VLEKQLHENIFEQLRCETEPLWSGPEALFNLKTIPD
jgi:hypothetical protein